MIGVDFQDPLVPLNSLIQSPLLQESIAQVVQGFRQVRVDFQGLL